MAADALTMQFKILARHLALLVVVYVRNSNSITRRVANTSTERQYDLVDLARQLGWSADQVRVLDQDRGLSAGGGVDRYGFEQLMTDVGRGWVGAILCLNAPRLARNNPDWARVIEYCYSTDTLVIDPDRIYNVRNPDEAAMLGLKGVMSVMELSWLKDRMVEGKRRKAAQGTLRFRPPIGYVHNAQGDLVRDPDEAVQEAVQTFFALFARCTSAWQLTQRFTTDVGLFPIRYWNDGGGGRLAWKPLTYDRTLCLLHNPFYAGTYAYGRTRSYTKVIDGKVRTRQAHSLGVEGCHVLLHDHHYPYISWAQYVQHQERLEQNHWASPALQVGAAMRKGDPAAPGVAREGAALAAGLARCGHCGYRMRPHYSTKSSSRYYMYKGATSRSSGEHCPPITGPRTDAAIEAAFFDAVEQATTAIVPLAQAQLEEQVHQQTQHWEQRLQTARAEETVTERRFKHADPAHRAITQPLEADWNAARLARLRVETEYQIYCAQPTQRIGPAEQAQLQTLTADLRQLWHAPEISAAHRKQLLRLVIKDITFTRYEQRIQILIRWQTEQTTLVEIPLLKRGPRHRTPATLLARIQALVPGRTYRQVAEQLNAEGLHTVQGLPFTPIRVSYLFTRHCLQR